MQVRKNTKTIVLLLPNEKSLIWNSKVTSPRGQSHHTAIWLLRVTKSSVQHHHFPFKRGFVKLFLLPVLTLAVFVYSSSQSIHGQRVGPQPNISCPDCDDPPPPPPDDPPTDPGGGGSGSIAAMSPGATDDRTGNSASRV